MKINIHFLVVLFLAIVAFISDIIIYFFSANYYLTISVISFVVFGCIIFLRKKKFIEISLDFEKTDLFLFIALLFITIFSGIVYPDYVYDTVSYHEYLQKNPFMDMVNEDFFPGRIYCMFLFPLGDRMFYIIRSLFGYRFGTVLSYYTVIVLFYQVKEILKTLTDGSKKASTFAYLVFLCTTYSIFIGTYYIDCLSLVMTIEILLIALKFNDLFKDKTKLYFVFLLSGISIGIKITQVFFVMPILLYILIKNRKDIKEIKIHMVMICMILAILPYTVYMLNSYVQTGSMLFPYYNEFLNSEYFGDYNWVDERFGLQNFVDYLLWPVIRGFHYGSYGDSHTYMDPVFGLSYIVVLAYACYFVIKKKKDKIVSLIPYILMMYLFWITIMYGYFRYGNVLAVIFTILMIAILIKAVDRVKIKNENIKQTILNISLIWLFIGFASISIYTGDFNNGKLIFKDRDGITTIDIEGVWGAPEDVLSYVSIVRDESDSIINLHRDYFKDSKKALSLWEDKVKSNDIYTIIPVFYDDEIEDTDIYELLIEDDFVIEEIIDEFSEDELPYVNVNSVWKLVKLKYVGE